MTFLAPGLLWGLAVLAPLIAIYFLKVRPRRKQTNAWFLWQLVLNEKQSSALFRRLRDLLSLLILALVVIAIVLAMSRPRVEQADERDLLIVIDTSASMLAMEGSETRLGLARERARGLVEALNGSRRAAIGTLSDRLRFVTHFTDSPKDLFRSLNRVEASAVPLDEEGVRELATLVGDESLKHRVLLLTDGVNGVASYPEGVEIMKVGTEQGNAAIVAADLQWNPGKKGRATFYFKVSSSFKEEKRCELILRHEESGRTKGLIPLVLQPGETESSVAEIENANPGRWTATLDVTDGLAEDNRVALGLNPLQPVRVQVQAANPYFYSHCITSFERSAGLVMLVDSGAEAVVVEGKAVDADRQLIFKPDGESPWWVSLGEPIEVLAPKARLKDHPLLRHLEIEVMGFGGARQIEAPESALILVETEDGLPLVYQVVREGQTAIVINADPNEQDLVLSPWFPVLIYDGARHLMGRDEQLRAVYATGRRLADLEEGLEVSEATLIDAEGGRAPVSATQDVTEAGHYEVTQGGLTHIFGAALLSADESILFRPDVVANAGPVQEGRPLAMWLLLIALFLIVAESLLYHRRKVG